MSKADTLRASDRRGNRAAAAQTADNNKRQYSSTRYSIQFDRRRIIIEKTFLKEN